MSDRIFDFFKLKKKHFPPAAVEELNRGSHRDALMGQKIVNQLSHRPVANLH